MISGKEIMKQCIEYAKNSFYIPKVGAIIIDKSGNIVGIGYRQRVASRIERRKIDQECNRNGFVYVTYHAEHVALMEAGEKALDGTLYVTIEPCVTRVIHLPHPQIPPCVDLIIESGIAKVVYALEDNNPTLRGRSAEVLTANGVEVELNDFGLEREIKKLIVNYAATLASSRGTPLTCRYSGGVKVSRKMLRLEREIEQESNVDTKRKTRMNPYKRTTLHNLLKEEDFSINF